MFEKYQHVERFGKDEVKGIEIGTCYVFPKMDGTNASVWWENGVSAGSRRRPITVDQDNYGFAAFVADNFPLFDFLFAHKNLRLFGEWLVPHTLKTYRDEAWRRFYIFDVMDGDKYLTYLEYQPLLEAAGLDYVPCIREVFNGSYETFLNIAEQNDFMMQPGEIGEGIVLKNYSYVNKYGRVQWAKIVRSEFKEEHVKAMGAPAQKGKALVEQMIADEYVTKTLVDKELAKIGDNEGRPIQPRLLATIWHCILTEEIAGAVKKLKNPTVDFKLLNYLVVQRTKKLAPELF